MLRLEWSIGAYLEMLAVRAELLYASCFAPVSSLHNFQQHSPRVTVLLYTQKYSEVVLFVLSYGMQAKQKRLCANRLRCHNGEEYVIKD